MCVGFKRKQLQGGFFRKVRALSCNKLHTISRKGDYRYSEILQLVQ